MFLKEKRGDSFMKMFIQEWKFFFKELGETLGNLWKKCFSKSCKCKNCKCNAKKEK